MYGRNFSVVRRGCFTHSEGCNDGVIIQINYWSISEAYKIICCYRLQEVCCDSLQFINLFRCSVRGVHANRFRFKRGSKLMELLISFSRLQKSVCLSLTAFIAILILSVGLILLLMSFLWKLLSMMTLRELVSCFLSSLHPKVARTSFSLSGIGTTPASTSKAL